MGGSAEKKAAAANRDAATKQNVANQYALTAQQQEIDRVAGDEQSDRMRQAQSELGLARAAAAEGVGNLSASVTEIMFNTQTSINRIAATAAGQKSAIQQQKISSAMGMQSTVTSANQQYQAGKVQQWLGSIGSGVQLYGAMNRPKPVDPYSHVNPDKILGGSSSGSKLRLLT